MESARLVKSRIPVQIVANSSTNRRNGEYDESHHHHYHHHQPRTVTSSKSINGSTSSPPARRHSTSRQMNNSVETLFREWDTGLRSRTETTLAVRPLTVSNRPDRDHQIGQRTPQRSTRGRAKVDCSRGAPATGDAVTRGETTELERASGSYSSADDSADDHTIGVVSRSRSISTRSQGADVSSPRTFRVEFNVEGYEVDDISVRVQAGRRLVVRGVRRETDRGRTSTTEFCRKIRLPDDVDPARLDCFLQPDGHVVVEAPRQQRGPSSAGLDTALPAANEPLNVPVITGTDRRQLGLLVEVGRVFRADDVVVKVKNSALALTVAAGRTEEPDVSGRGRLTASVKWEFDLPAAVDVNTLRAGLTVDGLLRVTATLPDPLPPSS